MAEDVPSNELVEQIHGDLLEALEAIYSDPTLARIHLRAAVVAFSTMHGLDIPKAAQHQPARRASPPSPALRPAGVPYRPDLASRNGIASMTTFADAMRRVAQQENTYVKVELVETDPTDSAHLRIVGKFYVRTGWERLYHGKIENLVLDLVKTFKVETSDGWYLDGHIDKQHVMLQASDYMLSGDVCQTL